MKEQCLQVRGRSISVEEATSYRCKYIIIFNLTETGCEGVN